MNNQKLGEFLVTRGILSRQELAEALKAQRFTRKKLGEVLVEQGYLQESQLTSLLGEYYGIPAFAMEEVDLNAGLLAMVPRQVAVKHSIVPVALKENEVFIACREPVSNAIVENLRRLTGKRVYPVLMAPSDLNVVLRQAYDIESAAALDVAVSPDAPDSAVKILDNMLFKAVAERASDLHLEPETDGMRIRLRVDGMLKTVDRLPAAVVPLIISRLKIMGNMNIAEKRSPQDGGFIFRQENGPPTNVRVSTLPCAKGEKAVLRLFSLSDQQLALADLGMEKDVLESFRNLLELPHGLFLVTGPTGSGKTFTLYSALKYLQSDSVNIITVEDPIELQMDGITQTQVDESAKKLTFSTALRSVLRQDPNIVMVGEIRDSETARLALQAALTGHLVLSTLHTNDAVSAIDRLSNMGCEHYLISSALRGVLAQRLVRILCPRCRQKYTPTPGELATLGLDPGSEEVFYSAKGCTHCQGAGYKGRTGIFELLVVNSELQKMISAGTNNAAIKGHVQDRMRSLREDGIIKLRRGLATVTDINKATLEL